MLENKIMFWKQYPVVWGLTNLAQNIMVSAEEW